MLVFAVSPLVESTSTIDARSLTAIFVITVKYYFAACFFFVESRVFNISDTYRVAIRTYLQKHAHIHTHCHLHKQAESLGLHNPTLKARFYRLTGI
jgi:hypothetical protein